MLHFESHSVDFAAAYRTAGQTAPEQWHGHNFTLRTCFQGHWSPSGILAPVRLIEQALWYAIEPFDGADLTDTQRGRFSLHLLAKAIRSRLAARLPSGLTLSHIELGYPVQAVCVQGKTTLYRHSGGFSAAHRTHAPRLTDAENHALYGICDNPAGHGHNYRASVWHSSPDAVPPVLWAEFDHRNLSVDLPDLHNRNVVTETIAALLAKRVPGAQRVRVWETSDFFAEYSAASPQYRLGRRYTFSAAHALAASSLDEAENLLLFGQCGKPGIHGHDFDVIVIVTGDLDPSTEAAYDLGALDRQVDPVLAALRNANLSSGVRALAGRPATPAALAAWLFESLAHPIGSALCAVGVASHPRQWSWTTRGVHG
jgi:6-pyruvoyltetrahydropterin/6-carboxytetrahydropterin synthase